MNKKFLNCQFTEVKVFEEEELYFSFEGYASTFGNVDRGNDIVERGAFAKSIDDMSRSAVKVNGTPYTKLMPVLWQHQGDMPIGSFVEMREDEKGLYVKGVMPKDDDFVKGRVIPQMKAGSVSDMSIGFMIGKQDWDGDIRKIKEAQLFETSLVTIPMNPEATVTAFKSIDNIDGLAVADRSVKWELEDTKGVTVQDGKAEINVSYTIDGKETIISDAVFKAALDVHQSKDLDHLKPEIEKLYKRMGMDSPFKKGAMRLDEMSAYTERELETLLKSGVCFSQKTAKVILNALKDNTQRDVEGRSQRDAELKVKLNELLKTLK